MIWTEVRPWGNTGHTWGAVALSMNGQIQVATIIGGNAGLYLSTDGGANWTQSFEASVFSTASMSDDGQTIFLGSFYGYGLITRDCGANWDVGPSGQYFASDMTPDGKTIVAVMSDGLYRSDDYGVSFAMLPAIPEIDPSKNLHGGHSVSISSDGNKIFLLSSTLFLSVDGGDTWTEQAASVSAPNWYASAMSKDGTEMIAGGHINGTDGGRLYLYKSGTWAEVQPMDANRHDWNAVALSDAGNVVFAGMSQLEDGSIVNTLWSSIDYGATWNGEKVWPYPYVNPEPTWNAITCRATTRILAGSNGKRLWLSATLPLPPVIHSFPWLGKFQLSHVTA